MGNQRQNACDHSTRTSSRDLRKTFKISRSKIKQDESQNIQRFTSRISRSKILMHVFSSFIKHPFTQSSISRDLKSWRSMMMTSELFSWFLSTKQREDHLCNYTCSTYNWVKTISLLRYHKFDCWKFFGEFDSILFWITDCIQINLEHALRLRPLTDNSILLTRIINNIAS